MYNLTERSIILGVTGSIAVYKAVDLTSKLTQAGAHVDVVMTPGGYEVRCANHISERERSPRLLGYVGSEQRRLRAAHRPGPARRLARHRPRHSDDDRPPGASVSPKKW